jgi:hypothetical protein
MTLDRMSATTLQLIENVFFEEMIPQNDDYKIYVFPGKPALID